MTTREQLGLNANWIPMDSSKSGGSDEFLIKKVNQLEEKVNELDTVSYRYPLTSATDMTELKYEVITEGTRHFLNIYLKRAPKSSKVMFKLNGTKEVIVTADNPFKLEMPEVIDNTVAQYKVHCFYLGVTLSDVLVSGVSDFKFGSEFIIVTPRTTIEGYRVVDAQINVTKVVDNSATKVSFLTRGYQFDQPSASKALELIKYSNDKNTFTTDKYLQTDVPVYLHPDYWGFILRRPSIDGPLISGTPRIKTLEVIGLSSDEIVFKELEFNWRSPEDLMKDKLQPIILSESKEFTNGIARGYEYGYYGDKVGYPVLVYAPTAIPTLLTYAYKTDLSEWLGYFPDESSGMFIKNSSQVPRYTGIPFSVRSEKGYGTYTEPSYVFSKLTNATLTNDVTMGELYVYGSNVTEKYNRGNQQSNTDAVNTLALRTHVGLSTADFSDGKTVEVWNFCNRVVRSAEVSTSTSQLSSLINSQTGEFNPDHRLYKQWKSNKCVLHQTLQRVGREIKVVNLEVTTLDVFFKNFIAKSEEWKAKNPSKVETEGSSKGNYTRKWSWNGSYDRL